METNFNQFAPPESNAMQTGNQQVQINPNNPPSSNFNGGNQNFQQPVQNNSVPEEFGQNFQPNQNSQQNQNIQPNQNSQHNQNIQPNQNFQQNSWGNQNSQQNSWGNQNFQQQQPRYKILDLYWLMNPKCEEETPTFEQGEAQFISLSYNITFGNLKVTLFNIPQGAIQGHVVFYNSLERLTTGTIYNGSCGKLLNTKGDITFSCLEQLFANTGQSWQTQRQMCVFERTDTHTMLTIKEPDGRSFWYKFTDWQLDMLIKSCEFCINDGNILSGQLKLKG